jgi:CheY-like chemotaxis protein
MTIAVAQVPAATLERDLQSRLLRVVCAVATLLGCAYSAWFAAVGLASATPTGPLCVAISVAAILVARTSGRAELGLDVVCVLLFAGLAGMALLQDGVRSPALWWLAVPPIVALVACRWRVGVLLCVAFAALASMLRVHGSGSWGTVSLLTDDPATQLTVSMTLAALSSALFVALGAKWRQPPTSAGEYGSVRGREDIVVLVAHDDAAKRDALVAMLESLAVAALVAADEGEALALLAARRFDLVLIGVGPLLDGLEVTRRWRAHETGARAARLPIVAVTDELRAVDVQALAEAGIDDILSAPFGLDDLQLLLREVVRREPGVLATPR